MGYSADTFSAGEQPTTAKWNKLWTNDASFNDGTGVAALTIGATTATKISYKFSAYQSTLTTLNAGAFTKVAFQTEEFDTGGNYDAATNYRFVAPIAGFYSFSSVVNMTAATNDNYAVSLYKNGSEYKRGNQFNAGSTAIGLVVSHPCIQLAANDYIEVYVFNGRGSSLNTNTGQVNTWFAGSLLSVT